MRYRKLKADRIFDGYRFLTDHVLVLDEAGTVIDLLPDNKEHGEIKKLEGVLVPGFINCHCHLELSHLKGVIPPGTGLVNFLTAVVKNRGKNEDIKLQSIAAAEKELFKNGIVAVADICNTDDAIEVKKESSIYWHNLVEVINFYDVQLEKSMQVYNGVLQKHHQNNFDAVLTPHAPYTVSQEAYKEINNRTRGSVISMHNQETAAEDELFENGSGEFLKLYSTFAHGHSPFAVSGKSSLQTWLPQFTNGQTILLVHNTFIKEDDILFAASHAAQHGLKIIYCLCPNANLYIENSLPPVDLLLQHNCTIVLGTDSYSSNWQLSIAAEIKTLREKMPHLSLQTLLQWATTNAAGVWSFEKVGAFEKGNKPGVVLLNEKDFSVERIA